MGEIKKMENWVGGLHNLLVSNQFKTSAIVADYEFDVLYPFGIKINVRHGVQTVHLKLNVKCSEISSIMNERGIWRYGDPFCQDWWIDKHEEILISLDRVRTYLNNIKERIDPTIVALIHCLRMRKQCRDIRTLISRMTYGAWRDAELERH